MSVVPRQLGFSTVIQNPALPGEDPYAHKFAKEDHPAFTVGVGPSLWYFVPSGEGHHAQVPQRPIPGSSADLDVVMKHCDFSMGKVNDQPLFRINSPNLIYFA